MRVQCQYTCLFNVTVRPLRLAATVVLLQCNFGSTAANQCSHATGALNPCLHHHWCEDLPICHMQAAAGCCDKPHLHQGTDFVRYWLHNGFVNVDSEKMSKSLGNFFTIRDVLKQYHPKALRWFLVGTHYRAPVNYTQKAVEEASDRVYYVYQTLADTAAALQTAGIFTTLLTADYTGAVT